MTLKSRGTAKAKRINSHHSKDDRTRRRIDIDLSTMARPRPKQKRSWPPCAHASNSLNRQRALARLLSVTSTSNHHVDRLLDLFWIGGPPSPQGDSARPRINNPRPKFRPPNNRLGIPMSPPSACQPKVQIEAGAPPSPERPRGHVWATLQSQLGALVSDRVCTRPGHPPIVHDRTAVFVGVGGVGRSILVAQKRGAVPKPNCRFSSGGDATTALAAA